MNSFEVSAQDEMLYMGICKSVGNAFRGMDDGPGLEDMADIFSVYYNSFAGKKLPDRWQCYEEVYQQTSERVYFSYNVPERKYNKGNVLLFTHNFSRTGAPMILLDAAKAFMELGYMAVVVSGETGDLLPLYLASGVSCVILPEVCNGAKYPKEVILRLAEGFDTIFVNTGVMGHIIDTFNGSSKKVFWWFHERKSEIEALGGLPYLPESLKENVTAAVVSECLKEEFHKDGINYSFSSLEGYVPDIEGQAVKEKGKINFIICGVVCERKGYHILLDAIEKLGVDKLENVSFWMIGKPDDSSMVNRIYKAAERFEIHYYETLSRGEVYNLYKKCDCCIVPSLFEPLPLVALESMSCGCFVICSDAVGASKYFTDDLKEITYRNCDDSSELADRISFVLSEQNKFERWSKSSRFIYERLFTWDKFKGRIAEIALADIGRKKDKEKVLFDMQKVKYASTDEINKEKEACLEEYFASKLLLNSRIKINELKRIQRIKDEYISWSNEVITQKDEVIEWKDNTIWEKDGIISHINSIVSLKDDVIKSKDEKISQTEAYCNVLKKTIVHMEDKIRQTEDYCRLLEKTIETKVEKIKQTEAWADLQRKEKEKFEQEVIKLRAEVESSIYLRLKRKINNAKGGKEE